MELPQAEPEDSSQDWRCGLASLPNSVAAVTVLHQLHLPPLLIILSSPRVAFLLASGCVGGRFVRVDGEDIGGLIEDLIYVYIGPSRGS